MPTDRQLDRPPLSLQGMTVVLVAIGTFAAELALAGPHGSVAAALAFASVLTVGLAGGHLYWRRCAEGGLCPRHGLPVVFGLGFVIGSVEVVRCLVRPEGLPLELQLFAAWRNLGLLLGAFVTRPLLLRIAGAVSASWVLFASCLVEGPILFLLLLAFALLGSLWLSTLYWSLVQRDLVSGTSGRLRIPLAAVVWSLLVLLVILVGAGPRHSAIVLAELLPTSGGSDQYDPRSRSGVNDGDEVTAARDHARSTGTVDSNIFFDSEERSFYDAAQDLYGEPRKPREFAQAIAIEAERMRHDHNLAEQQQARREFALTRRESKQPRRPIDRLSDALFHVEGPGPVHVRMIAYDTCDGLTLQESPAPAGRPELSRQWGGWLRWERLDRPDVYAGTVRHTFRIVKLEARQLPVPPHLDQFLLGRVDQPRFFGWAYPGIIGLVDGKMPRNTVLQTRCRVVDEELLRAWTFPSVTRYAMPQYRELPPNLRNDDRIKNLAHAIVGDTPRGWGQVTAIERFLRENYFHVRDAKVPEDRDDPVPWFLFDSKTGPDYLFAAGACVLLRELNYPARVVTGFYVDPRRYDAEAGQISVYPDDIHFWTEVLIPGEEWVTVEPTPGYFKMAPPPHWASWLYQLGTMLVGTMLEHPAVLVGGALVLVAGLWHRRRLLAGWYWLRWRIAYRGPWPQRVLTTLRLLESWARLRGRSRPTGWTPMRWYERHLRPHLPEAHEFFRLTALAAYGMPHGDFSGKNADAQCKLVIRRFRETASRRYRERANFAPGRSLFR